MKRLANWLSLHQPKTILDVASGAGNFIAILKSLYDDYDSIVGIDSLAYAVNSAKKNYRDDSRISFEQMDAANLTFHDASFDLVVLSNSLHHLSDQVSVLSEMARVVKPGGYVLISEMIANDLSDAQISHLKIHHFAAKIDRYFGETHENTYTQKTILNILSAMPISIEEHWHLFYTRTGTTSDDEITWLNTTLDKMISRVNNQQLQDELKQEATEIKTYLDRYGFDSATTLIVVMKR